MEVRSDEGSVDLETEKARYLAWRGITSSALGQRLRSFFGCFTRPERGLLLVYQAYHVMSRFRTSCGADVRVLGCHAQGGRYHCTCVAALMSRITAQKIERVDRF